MQISFDAKKGIGNPNTTPIPDQFLDEIAPGLSGAAVKVMLYIFRRTYGFKKDQDAIAFSQFLNGIVRKKDGKRLDFGAGVGRTSLCEALDQLVELGLIFRHRQYAANGGKEATLYEINRDGYAHFDPGSFSELPPSSESEPTPSSEKELPPSSDSELTPSSENEHTRNRILQQTVIQHTEVISKSMVEKPNSVCVSPSKTSDGKNPNKRKSELGDLSPTDLLVKRDSANKHYTLSRDTSHTYSETLIAEIRQLGINAKKVEELLGIASKNERNDEHIRGWLDQARHKNNPAAYFITLVRDDADLASNLSRYKAVQAPILPHEATITLELLSEPETALETEYEPTELTPQIEQPIVFVN